MNKSIELLAPAGSKDSFLAAIVAGADAIYFGLEEFNARKRAENIKVSDLPLLCAAAHAHNCKCYLTLNIIFFDEEFDRIMELVSKAVTAGIDAVIVQDIGAIRFLEQNFPTLAVHVSTQVTVHNTAIIDFLAQFSNVTQVNLSRELSLTDIAIINKKLAGHNLKSEIFVHGAYCISFSGQCYMSGLLYGEAGNRGACVQPCRRAYTADYEGSSNIESAESEFTPFNLKDNCAFNVADQLAQTGADSFKIEGRIKSAEYVWAVVSAWREKIDGITKKSYKAINTEASKQYLTASFNRGFSDDYLLGHASSTMFASQNGNADEKDKSVFNAGTVISYTSDTKILIMRQRDIKNDTALEKGTKITIRNTNGLFVCSAEITQVVSKPGLKTGSATYQIHLTSKPDAKNPLRISHGQLVTAQPLLISGEKLKQLCSEVAAIGNRALNDKGVYGGSKLNVFVAGTKDEKLVAKFEISESQTKRAVTVCSDSVLSEAQNRGLSKETIASKLCAFGGTPYELDNLDCSKFFEMHDDEIALFLPLKELKAMRREAIEQLDATAERADKTDAQADEINNLNNSSDESRLPFNTASEIKKPLSEATEESINIDSVDPKFAVIYSDINALEAERETTTKLGEKEYEIAKRILEIPIVWETQTEEYLLAHKDVIPLFSAILLEQDLQRSGELLTKMAHDTSRLVWCENVGLAFLAHKKGLRVIGGVNLNSNNQHAIETYSTLLGCEAVMLSPEMSLDNVTKLKSNTEIWFSLTSNQLLMQSKQCLSKNIPDENGKLCPKQDCDRDCLLTCDRHVQFKDLQNNHLHGVNRPGFYSALYKKNPLNRQSLLATPYGNKLKAVVDMWVIDARTL